jgi:hypothetical protein
LKNNYNLSKRKIKPQFVTIYNPFPAWLTKLDPAFDLILPPAARGTLFVKTAP